ncbi:uncharacterized protein [Aristolochia californica]|uniref:uncharacterized protein n=1 Tax=Aristolochia californica TaxID=171875 RepID=UPI0035E179B9
MNRESIGASSLRSSTPTASRSDHNFNTPDSCVRRKSFTGTSIPAVQRKSYTVTPANSPASQEIPPRKMRSSFEKENEKDRTASSSVRIQSPVISKGTKNFMAPTISTASKVAASPKKKILSERNETVRSSDSLSDVKSSVTSMNSLQTSGTEKACCNPEISSVSLSIPSKHSTSRDQIYRASVSFPNGNSTLVSEEVSDISKTGSGRLEMENEVGSEIRSHNPKLSISGEGPESLTPDNSKLTELLEPKISEPEIQSHNPKLSISGEGPESLTPDNSKLTELLEPKISEPVYKDDRLDPKKNNFSFQALPHNSSRPPYNPQTNYLSPRPQFLHHRPNSRIDICLTRENDSHSDKGIKLEESFGSKSSSDTEESVEIPKDSEESLSHDEEAEGCEETCVTEISNSSIKRRSRSYLYGERKVKSVLLVCVIIASLSMSITDSPGMIISSYLHEAFFPNQLFAPAYENLEWAAHSFKHWSTSYWSEAILFFKIEKKGKFQFANLTSLDHEICNLLDIMAAENQANILHKKGMTQQIVEDFTEEKLHETSEDFKDHKGSNFVEEGHSVYSMAEAMQNQITSELESEEQNKEDAADHLDYESKAVADDVVAIVRQTEPQYEEVLSRHESTKNIDIEVAEEIADAALEAEQLSSQIGEEPESQENITMEYHTYIRSESTSEEAPSGKLNKHRVHIALTSFAFLALASLSSTIYLKHKKASAVQPKVLKQSCSVSASSDGHSYLKGSRNSEMEVEMLEGSGPSEMSSSVQKSSSYSRRTKVEEIQSVERKARRNSSVSDHSAESPSLGSFTTYETLHGKHGCEENDVLTPVRRSSRIRKKITSP